MKSHLINTLSWGADQNKSLWWLLVWTELGSLNYHVTLEYIYFQETYSSTLQRRNTLKGLFSWDGEFWVIFQGLSQQDVGTTQGTNFTHPYSQVRGREVTSSLEVTLNSTEKLYVNEVYMIIANIYWISLCARHCIKHFTCIISLNLCNHARQY